MVDDEVLNRAILREMLSTVGFDVAEADSSKQALSRINDGFGVVISDIRMPATMGIHSAESSDQRQRLKG